jgi:hypothetical protein
MLAGSVMNQVGSGSQQRESKFVGSSQRKPLLLMLIALVLPPGKLNGSRG